MTKQGEGGVWDCRNSDDVILIRSLTSSIIVRNWQNAGYVQLNHCIYLPTCMYGSVFFILRCTLSKKSPFVGGNSNFSLRVAFFHAKWFYRFKNQNALRWHPSDGLPVAGGNFYVSKLQMLLKTMIFLGFSLDFESDIPTIPILLETFSEGGFFSEVEFISKSSVSPLKYFFWGYTPEKHWLRSQS